MKNKNLFLYYCLVLLFSLNGCGSTSNTFQKDKDFQFILKYGVDAKNILNTFDGTYTKDMVVDSLITIKFSLSKEELDSIKSEMEEIKIFEYPEMFNPNETDDPPSYPLEFSFPFRTYYFKIKMGDKVKEILWADSNQSVAIKARRIRNLIYRIIDLIESKAEYKKLPRPNGAYI